MRIVWTLPAIGDLDALKVYVARDNTAAAERQAERVLLAVGNLVQFPEIGRPGRRAGTRELVVSGTPYIVPYRIKGEAIEILRVLHGRRRWPERL
ncbi:MAG: type II toxin-antitoxin system RelE/ParE family toxin [Stellaceae bacterium]